MPAAAFMETPDKPRDQYDPLGIGQQRRPGFFGGVGRWLSSRDWQRIGATLRDDPTHLQMLLAERQGMAETARREAEAEAERMRADRAYKYGIQSDAIDDARADRALDQDQSQFEASQATTRRGQDLSRASSGGADAGAYHVMSPEEIAARGLPPGSYQLNTRTNQVTPIGRVRGQYTEYASTSAGYANRMTAANDTLAGLELQTDPTDVYAARYTGGDQNVRRVRQAQREFVNAILRRESGAVIADSEFESARMQYFAVPGDSPEVIEQKRQARLRAIEGLINSSQGAFEEWHGDYAPLAQSQEIEAAAATPQRGVNRPRGAIRGSPRRPAGVPETAQWNPATRSWEE